MTHPGFSLAGKVVLVTGGNGGLGLGYATGVAKAGADVVIWGRDAAKNVRAADALKRHGTRVVAMEVDVTDEAAVEAGFAEAVARMGRIDTVFANAGGSTPAQPLQTTPTETFTGLMDLNVNSVFYTVRAAARHMIARGEADDADRGGSIVITGSLSTLAGLAGQPNYTASKHAVAGLMKSAAVELGKHGIRVNALAPGLIRTALLENPDPVKAARIKAMEDATPIPRLGRIDDFEGICVYLASDLSSFHSGDVIVIDGAWSAKVI
ncbi:MAG: SDR family oxidoreductase [Novosphingobium sp.]|nr:SDR family oxidoreductase [Novosphingobium sp.]